MTDPRELITRLRQLGSGVCGTISGEHCPLLNEAADTIEALAKDVSHWRLQYRFACCVLFNFIELFDAADGTAIDPPVELLEAARYHAARGGSGGTLTPPEPTR